MRTISKGLELLDNAEKKKIFIIALFTTAAAMLETLALSATLPLITLILEPAKVTANTYFNFGLTILGSPEHDKAVIIVTALVVALLLISASLNLMLRHLVDRLYAACWRRLSHDLMSQCLHSPYIWFLGRNTTKLTRLFFQDINLWSRDFVRYILSTFSDFISILFISTIAILVVPTLGAIVILVVILIAICTLLLIRSNIHRYAQIKRETSDDMILHSNQAISGVKDIKLNSREDQFTRLFDGAVHNAAHAFVWSSFWTMLPPMQMLLFGQLGLIGITIALWASGMSNGEIATYLALGFMVSSRAIPAINRITSSTSALWSVAPFIDGITEIATSLKQAEQQSLRSNENNLQDTPHNWQTLSFHDIGFQYHHSAPPVLKGVNFKLARNGIYGFAGASGAGKSTLIDILIGLFEPSTGVVSIDEMPIKNISLQSWQKQIGYVPQNPYLLDASLRDNISYNLKIAHSDDQEIMRCLEAAHLGEFVQSLAQGLATPMGDRGASVSGGQLQRIAIARALYQKPSILIFDEATSALDSVSEEHIRKLIQELRGKVTVVIIAHRFSTLKEVDNIFLMKDGEIIDDGHFSDLTKNNSIFAEMVALQTDNTNKL